MKQGDKKHIWMIGIILLLAVLIRSYQLDFGKPHLYHPDEIKLVAQAGRLLDTKFMDKDTYFGINVYPPFYTYMLAVAIGVYAAIGLVTGRFDSLSDVSAVYSADPFQFFMVSRILVLLLGAATVLFVFLIGKRLYSKNVGLISAALLAVNFLHVRHSHFGTVDVPAAFFGILTIYFCVLMYQKGKMIYYALAAAVMAVAVAVKFSMPLLLFPFIIAHFARYEPKNWFKEIFSKKIWVAAFVGLLVFLIACPLIWLDFDETWGGIMGTKKFEKVGKIGSGGGLLSYWTGDQAPGFGVFYPNSIPETCGLAFTIFIVIGMLYLVYRHKTRELLLLAFILPTYWLFEDSSIKAMRHLVPLAPFFALCAGIALQKMFFTKRFKLYIKLVGVALLLWMLIWNFKTSINYHTQLAKMDPRTPALTWIQANLPVDSKIIVEDFPPQLVNNADKDEKAMAGYDLIQAGLSRKTLDSTSDIKKIFTSGESCYYISDSFSREIFSWSYTLEHYAEIARDRRDFFQWLDEHATVLQEFPSEYQAIQPTIVVYQFHQD